MGGGSQMIKILTNVFLILGLIFLFLRPGPDVVFAQNANTVKAYLVIPSDWKEKISPSTQERYKSSILRTLEEAKQFYSSKLNGHTFSYENDVPVFYSKGSTSGLKSIYCVADVAHRLGDAPFPPSGKIYLLFIAGSSNYWPCANYYSSFSARAYFDHQMIEELGSPIEKVHKYSLGVIMHELGHALGVPHPCSQSHKGECPPIFGLGTSIPYPPHSESEYSIVGSGADHMDDLRVGFNNSVVNPEIYTLFKSPFINPSGDPPPSPTPSVVMANSQITQISPNPISVGQELIIKGSGFGAKMGIVQFKDPKIGFSPKFGYENKIWTDNEIRISLIEGPRVMTAYEVSVLTTSGLEIGVYPQTTWIVTVNPKISSGKIISISPNTVTVGDEITITGSGFGTKTGGFEFTDAFSGGSFIVKYEVKSWTDSGIKIVLLEELKKFPAVISVLPISGEKITAPQPLHSRLSTQSSSPKPQITQVSPNPIMVGQEAVISGSGFGQNRSIIIQPVDANLSRIGNYRINSWTDTEIRISILDGPVTPTPYNFILVYLGKDILSPQVIIQKFPSSVSPIISPSPIQKSTPAASVAPTIPSIPTQTTPASSSSISSIKISNYKDFRDNVSGDEGSSTQIFSSSSTSPIIWSKSTLDPNSPVYIAPMNPDGTNAPILEVFLSNGQQLSIPNSSFVVQAKVIKKIVKINVNSQEFTSNFNQAFPIHLPGAEGVAGTYQIPVIVTYNDGSIKSLLFTFNYVPPTQPSVSPLVFPSSTPISSETCGSTFAAGPCSASELGQAKKNACITVSGLAGQSVMECKQVGSIYCWYDAYTDPVNFQVKSQFCYESKEASLPGLPENKLSCSNPTCLRGSLTQYRESWYCYEGERWVGDALCLSSPSTDLSKCDQQKITCQNGEIPIRSVNGVWICVNISTGQITNTVPSCSQ